MFSYKLLISYCGKNYFGWQIQAANQVTIQGTLNEALSKIAKSTEVQSIGSGRTDAGVHALGQVVKIEIPLSIDPQALMRALNSHLPSDIRIREVTETTTDFHPIFSAKKKEYLYLFNWGGVPTPFQDKLVTNVPYNLDVKTMQDACKLFVGEHDFCNFYTLGTDVKSTVRTIYSADIAPYSAGFMQEHFPGVYVFRVVGNGFLKQMVRLLMGTIWEAGRGKIQLSEIESYLQGKSFAKKLAAVAPPDGLYLSQVDY
jgi:tRNA pseudouridine38-40 synthase